MVRGVVVGYKYVQDLYYRVRHARLMNEVYTLDFLDWIKAGVAFNVNGVKEPSRKVSNFVALYHAVQSECCAEFSRELCDGLHYYYEDLFRIYQDHLVAQLRISQQRASRQSPEVSNLVLLPSFESTPAMSGLFETIDIELASYSSKYPDDFLESLATIYAREGSVVYQLMSVYYDMGVRREGNKLIGRVII